MLPNTLGVPCKADRCIVARTGAQLIAALERHAQDLVVLGGCSNVVLPARLKRPVCLVATRGIELRPEGGSFLVTAAAGESWHGLVRRTLGSGLGGLENLALIPGSVGAAPIQNIGAYGVELAERIVSVRVFDRTTEEIEDFSPERCGFGYRTSVFKIRSRSLCGAGSDLAPGPPRPARAELSRCQPGIAQTRMAGTQPAAGCGSHYQGAAAQTAGSAPLGKRWQLFQEPRGHGGCGRTARAFRTRTGAP